MTECFSVCCVEYSYSLCFPCVCSQGDIDRVPWQSPDQDGGRKQTANGLKGNSLPILKITLKQLIRQKKTRCNNKIRITTTRNKLSSSESRLASRYFIMWISMDYIKPNETLEAHSIVSELAAVQQFNPTLGEH